MTYSIYFICAVLIQLSSAQVLSYVQRSPIPQQVVANIPNAINNAKPATNNAVSVARAPNAVPVGANVGANVATNPVANTNLAHTNAINAVGANAPTHSLTNPNYAASYANAANYANTNYANAANYGNAAYANQNIASSLANAPIAPANAAVANSVVNANLNNEANTIASIANGNLPTINGNMATFNLGTNGNTFTVTSGSPGAQGFGISVIADALEVGGTVAVNGQIPIFGTVAVNGNVPTDGSASVSYNCGGKLPATVPV